MKICWDNLEKLVYTKKGNFRDRNKGTTGTTYYYKDSCISCGEPFLSAAGRESFCNIRCSTTFFADKRKDIPLSKVTKEKLRKKALIRGKHSITHCKAISEGMNKRNHRAWKGGLKEKNLCGFDIYSKQLFADEIRRNLVDKRILQVKCAYCGKWFNPTRSQINNRLRAINGKSSKGAEERLYCSTECKQECPIYHQVLWPKGFKLTSSREVQPELRQMCFERDSWVCQKCGKTKNLHCHHIEGILWEPLESADLDKVITLCKNCHKEVHRLPGCGYHDMKCEEDKDV